jgi:hypothetical protein
MAAKSAVEHAEVGGAGRVMLLSHAQPARGAFSSRPGLDGNHHLVGESTTVDDCRVVTVEGAAHDQLVVYEEGRSDSHPEADALVHVQLTCGLACYGANRWLRH